MSTNDRQGRSLRTRVRKNYRDNDDEFLEQVLEKGAKWSIEEKFQQAANYRGDFVRELTAGELNVAYFQRTGFPHPIVIREKRGLDLRVPTAQFSIHDVRKCIGSQRMIDVMNVETQESLQMSMKAWAEYYAQPREKRAKLLNVISLEFSHTPLERYVESPAIVRAIDWVSNAWPSYWQDLQAHYQTHLKQEHMYYPKTRKYCLMSVAQCFTDFHIDMGGSSVWYHVVKGRKVFWLLPPSESHLRLYEEWTLAGRQNECFFADLCAANDCQMIILEPGWTFFLPSGWIHAVYTLEDSLVFGGNFLNSFKIPMQIEVWNIERKTRVPDRFRYPYFIQSMWYLIERYVQALTGMTHIAEDCLADAEKQADQSDSSISLNVADLKPCQTSRLLRVNNNNKDIEQQHQHLTPFELAGLQTLCSLLRKLKDKSIPEDLIQPQALLQTMERLLSEHASDQPHFAITGQALIHYNYPSSYQNDTETFQGIKRKNPEPDEMQPGAFHQLHSTHQYETLTMPQPTSNIVTLHPSTTILLSGPLASSNYYPPPPQQPQPPPPPPPPAHYSNNYTPQHYSPEKNLPGKDRHKRVRCKQCEPCCRDDCSECVHCKDMPKFGGVGKMKQCCLTKQCIAPILPSTASCQVCLKKKGSRKLSQLKPEEVLYECERCMEIHHLPCFHSAHPDSSSNEGVFSDDIPETWLCPKCISVNAPEPPLYKLRPIVRRTLVTTNKGKSGLIELPYSDPTQQPVQQQQQQHPMMPPHQHYQMYAHSSMYHTNPYEVMENEAKKRRLYASMYPNNGNPDSSMLPLDPSAHHHLHHHHHHHHHNPNLDDLSQTLTDSDLYIPPMFAV